MLQISVSALTGINGFIACDVPLCHPRVFASAGNKLVISGLAVISAIERVGVPAASQPHCCVPKGCLLSDDRMLRLAQREMRAAKRHHGAEAKRRETGEHA